MPEEDTEPCESVHLHRNIRVTVTDMRCLTLHIEHPVEWFVFFWGGGVRCNVLGESGTAVTVLRPVAFYPREEGGFAGCRQFGYTE